MFKVNKKEVIQEKRMKCEGLLRKRGVLRGF